MILKLAIGLIVMCWLFVGTMYSSEGLTMTELASTVAGGNANVCHLELSTSAVAKVVRSVVIATGGISPPLM